MAHRARLVGLLFCRLVLTLNSELWEEIEGAPARSAVCM